MFKKEIGMISTLNYNDIKIFRDSVLKFLSYESLTNEMCIIIALSVLKFVILAGVTIKYRSLTIKLKDSLKNVKIESENNIQFMDMMVASDRARLKIYENEIVDKQRMNYYAKKYFASRKLYDKSVMYAEISRLKKRVARLQPHESECETECETEYEN